MRECLKGKQEESVRDKVFVSVRGYKVCLREKESECVRENMRERAREKYERMSDRVCERM